MRPNLFNAQIHKKISSALGKHMLDAVLTKTTAGTRDGSALTGGRTVSENDTTHNCKGFTDAYKETEIDGTSIKMGDRKIVILGGTLPDAVDPEPGDTITIEGVEWRIVPSGVMRDPVGATFTCQVRQ